MARRKRKRRARGTLIIIAIALLIAGFVVRRTLLPQFLHYLAYRPPENPSPAAPANSAPPETASRQKPEQASPEPAAVPARQATNTAPSEHLTQRDRQELEDILKRKNK